MLVDGECYVEGRSEGDVIVRGLRWRIRGEEGGNDEGDEGAANGKRRGVTRGGGGLE